MHDLGEHLDGGLSAFEQLLALEVALTALACHRGKVSCPMLGQSGNLPLCDEALVLGLPTAGHDFHAISVQMQRSRQTRSLGGHGVAASIVEDLRGGARRTGIRRASSEAAILNGRSRLRSSPCAPGESARWRGKAAAY